MPGCGKVVFRRAEKLEQSNRGSLGKSGETPPCC